MYPEAAQNALILAVLVALSVSVSLGLLGFGHLPLGILWQPVHTPLRNVYTNKRGPHEVLSQHIVTTSNQSC